MLANRRTMVKKVSTAAAMYSESWNWKETWLCRELRAPGHADFCLPRCFGCSWPKGIGRKEQSTVPIKCGESKRTQKNKLPYKRTTHIANFKVYAEDKGDRNPNAEEEKCDEENERQSVKTKKWSLCACFQVDEFTWSDPYWSSEQRLQLQRHRLRSLREK